MKIKPATAEDIYEVALHMRDRDFKEINALNTTEGRDALAEVLARRYIGCPDILCASLDGKPIAVGGFLCLRPNVVSLMLFATNEFNHIGLSLTRWIKNEMFPRLEKAGVHRIEALSLDGYNEVHDWLRVLGLEDEGCAMRAFGKNKEDFRYFAKVTDARSAGSGE